MFTLVVPGQPVPQPRVRVSTRGGFGRAYTPSRHPIHAYRASIAALAAGKRIAGPTALAVEAIFARPPSHWRKSGLKADAPAWPRADGDNVLKGVADALTDACVWDDDDQVIRWEITKRYGARDELPRTVITVTEFAP